MVAVRRLRLLDIKYARARPKTCIEVRKNTKFKKKNINSPYEDMFFGNIFLGRVPARVRSKSKNKKWRAFPSVSYTFWGVGNSPPGISRETYRHTDRQTNRLTD